LEFGNGHWAAKKIKYKNITMYLSAMKLKFLPITLFYLVSKSISAFDGAQLELI